MDAELEEIKESLVETQATMQAGVIGHIAGGRIVEVEIHNLARNLHRVVELLSQHAAGVSAEPPGSPPAP